MTIVAVNGGGNTPNGEAAGARSEEAYVLTGVEHTAREDSGEADTFSFDQSVSENSDLAFWGKLRYASDGGTFGFTSEDTKAGSS